MTDHFRIEGPAVINVSGGRTSALMLRRVLDAHGGRLPADVRVVFANTGDEREETLRFLSEIERRWCALTWSVARGFAVRYVDRFGRDGRAVSSATGEVLR